MTIDIRRPAPPAGALAGTPTSRTGFGRADHSLTPDNLTVVTAISNSQMWESRIALYHEFEEHMLDSGVKLIVVECTYGDHEPQLFVSPRVQHIHVKADGRRKVWVKENLLNLGIARTHAKYIATLDADVTFRNTDWAWDTLHALQHYDVIQPWSYCYDLGPHGEHVAVHRSFANLYYAKGVNSIHQGPNADSKYEFGHPGYAWAWTRRALERLGGLVETAALGAADHHMALALVGKVGDTIPSNLTAGYKAPLYLWQEHALTRIAGHVGALPGTIEHGWHGDKAKRAYVSRWDILARNGFDPRTDLRRNTYGVLELAGNKPQLAHDIDAYLLSRDEDGNSLG